MHVIFLSIAVVTFMFGAVDAAESVSLRGGSFMDPKSTEEKQVNLAVQPFVPPKNVKPAGDYSDLKFAFFGTSRTFGTFLKDPATTAFANVLGGDNGLNLGIPSGTPDHPRTCTYSMLRERDVPEDESFDVIVLEYPRPFLQSTTGLAKRLHQRFPNALIIHLDTLLPCVFTHLPSGKGLQAWVVQEGLNTTTNVSNYDIVDKEIEKLVKERTKPEDWGYPHPLSEAQRQEFDDTVGGHILTLPLPNDAHAILDLRYRQLFFPDMNHPTEAGHTFIADSIRLYMKDRHFRTFHDPTVNPWEYTDRCNQWLKDGIIDKSLVTEYERGAMVMNNFKPTRNKFALELRAPHSFLKIQNTLGTNAYLMIEYMITSPNCLYPEIMFHITSVDHIHSANEPIALGCAVAPYPFDVHLSHQVEIGSIPPGESLIHLNAVDESTFAEKWPFRIIAIDLSPESSNKRGSSRIYSYLEVE